MTGGAGPNGQWVRTRTEAGAKQFLAEQERDRQRRRDAKARARAFRVRLRRRLSEWFARIRSSGRQGL